MVCGGVVYDPPYYPSPRGQLLRKGRLKQKKPRSTDQSKEDELPNWFFEHCVRTAPELRTANHPAVLVRVEDGSQYGHVRANNEQSTKRYAVDSIVYEMLSNELSPEDAVPAAQFEKQHRKVFRHDAVFLRLPRQHVKSDGSHFLTAIVQQFATDAEADLIRVGADDVEDVAEHLDFATHKNKLRSAEVSYTRLYFEDIESILERKSEKETRHREDALIIPPYKPKDAIPNQHLSLRAFPFERLLNAAKEKEMKNKNHAAQSSARPLIVHLKKFNHFIEVCGDDFFLALQDAIVESGLNVLVILTEDTNIPDPYSSRRSTSRRLGTEELDKGTSDASYPPLPRDRLNQHIQNRFSQERILWASGNNPRWDVIELAPIGSLAQKVLFEEHRESEACYEQENIRYLQRLIRRHVTELRDLNVVQPFSDWRFLEGSATGTGLATQGIERVDAKNLICALSPQSTESFVKDTLLHLGKRQVALQQWSHLFAKGQGSLRWSCYTPQIQKTIKGIEESGYKWEQRILELLITPEEVEEGWSQIALEAEVKEHVLSLLDQSSNVGLRGYGVLRKGHVGGALLYGPPGTGKTHLARVIARESNNILICASAADLEHKYVGEGEKAIQALFRVARMLSPCTIFIDEADGLFRARQSGDKSWERTRMNQLLLEMDGLKRLESPPFVLIATNHPNELDHAVLRRVPSRIHIGLPELGARRRIFEILLKDETIEEGLGYCCLAERSQGLSGSDIQTVCVQAALVCNSTMKKDGSRRLLKLTHFEKAFRRSAPTVSKAALASINKFAKEFDPASLRTINHEEEIHHENCLYSRSQHEILENVHYAEDEPLKQGVTHLPNEGKINRNGNAASITTLPSMEKMAEPTGNTTAQDFEARAPEKLQSKASSSSYQYTSLKSNSKQIRVLSINTKSKSESQTIGEELLDCSLITVDLEEWTPMYRNFKSKYNAQGSSQSPQQLLEGWFGVCGIRDGFRNGKQPVLGQKNAEGRQKFEASVSMTPFGLLRGDEKVDERFIWGDYIALSYVWGDPEQRHDILLNGYPFSITANLHQALQSLSQSSEIRYRKLYIWADAICINQADLTERASEVKKMDLIYSSSLLTKAWLGSADPEFLSDIKVIRVLLESISNIDMRDFGTKMRWEAVTNAGAVDVLATVGNSLFITPYWERTWIIQELMLPPLVLFCYSNETFTAEEIMKLSYILSRAWMMKMLPEDDEAMGAAMMGMSQAMFRLMRLRTSHDYHDEYRPVLRSVDLVRLCQTAKASDARDKVFGLLGVLPASIVREIEVSYDSSCGVRDVFTNLTKSYIDHDGDLRSLARVARRPSLTPNLPSWAFDLEARHDISDLTLHKVRHRTHQANLNLSIRKPAFSQNGRLLYCEGAFMDTVSSLGSIDAYDPRLGFSLSLEAKSEPLIESAWKTIDPKNIDWKLAVARVLLQDSKYTFSEAPSVLDIPWLDPSEIDKDAVPHDIPLYEFSNNNRKWTSYYPLTVLPSVFKDSLLGNAGFDIGGKPLRDYFTSTETICSEPALFKDISQDLKAGLSGNRLAMTRGGLLGTVPQYTDLGDIIAVVSSCDMPIVLRPNGQHYEFIGSCFVEGLMNGESAIAIARGRAEMQPISIS